MPLFGRSWHTSKVLRFCARTCSYPRVPWDILLIFFVLGVIVPLRGRARLKQLLAKPRVESAERRWLYGATIAFQWLAAVVAACRAWPDGFTAEHLGLAFPGRLAL